MATCRWAGPHHFPGDVSADDDESQTDNEIVTNEGKSSIPNKNILTPALRLTLFSNRWALSKLMIAFVFLSSDFIFGLFDPDNTYDFQGF